MTRRKRQVSTAFDETDWIALDEVVECGGQLMFAIGETSGGFPFGPTIEELKESEERDNPEAGWVRAKRAFRRAFESQPDLEIGRVKWISAGLSRDAFAAWIEVPDDPKLSGSYVALLPKSGSDPKLDERCRREALIHKRLNSLPLSFKIPQMLQLVPESGRIILVREFVEGIQLDLRSGRQTWVKPWELIATIASSIHGQPTTFFEELKPAFPTRKEFALAKLAAVSEDSSSEPEVRDALQWAHENLPLPDSLTLIHGDLLGQNILLSLENEATVIDWEYACLGDPAWDIAIVTRGVKKPFQISGGLERLLEFYHQLSGRHIVAKDVHFYELCLALGWYRQTKCQQPRSGQVQADLARISAILRRVCK